MSVLGSTPRPRGAVARPVVGRPVLQRATQAIAIGGAFTLGIVIALMLPGTARGAEPGPVGAEDAYDAPHDGVLSVDAAHGVLVNDTGSGLEADLWIDPTYGDLMLSPDGGFVYSRTDRVRSDTFVYLATDADGLSSDPVRVTIDFADRPPTCGVARITASPAGAPVQVDLAASCTDPDGDPMTFEYQQPDIPDGSVWDADALGQVHFLPPPDWTGTGTVIFSADDGLSTSMPAALAIEVVSGD